MQFNFGDKGEATCLIRECPTCSYSGNDFVRFSVPFLENRISDICAACNYSSEILSTGTCIMITGSMKNLVHVI